MGTENYGEVDIEEYNRFVNKIDLWIKQSAIIDSYFDEEKVEQILRINVDDFKNYNNNELSKFAYQLYGYVDHLQKVYNQEKCVLEFADESIWHVISKYINNYGNEFTKWQVKYHSAIQENPLASKLSVLRNNVRARVTLLEGRLDTVKRRAEILLELSRRF